MSFNVMFFDSLWNENVIFFMHKKGHITFLTLQHCVPFLYLSIRPNKIQNLHPTLEMSKKEREINMVQDHKPCICLFYYLKYSLYGSN
jgi:hypothetical protein